MTALAQAVRTSRCEAPDGFEVCGPIRWGTQVDVAVIGGESGPQASVVARYLAKYATKSTESSGLLDRPVRAGDLARLQKDLTPHMARFVQAAWTLGGREELAALRLRPWAHTLGYRGHWLTKSRRYSTSLSALRAARHRWRLSEEGDVEIEGVAVRDWSYAGNNWKNAGDALLVRTAALDKEASRYAAWLENRPR